MEDKELRFWTTNGNHFLVASLKSQPEKVIGCVAYQDIGSGTIEVNRLSVDSGFRGLGIAKSLMDTVFYAAKKSGHTRVYLVTSNGHESAIQLYRKLGFKEVIGKFKPSRRMSKFLTILHMKTYHEFSFNLK